MTNKEMTSPEIIMLQQVAGKPYDRIFDAERRWSVRMTKSAGDRTLQGAGALNVYIGQLMDNLTLLSAQAVKLHDETSTLAGVLAEVPDAMACGGTAESPEPTKL